MLAFFRGLTKSKWGLALLFAFLGLIAFAFVASDLGNNLSNSGVDFGAGVAEVGDQQIGEADLSARVQQQFEAARAENPTLDVAGFVRAGGVEQTLDALINGVALQAFGQEQGMIVSRRMEDGEIASIPSFRGPTGEFDENLFRQLLRDRRITETQLRADIQRDLIAQQMIIPVTGATRPPVNLVLPYASLLLEARQGRIAYVPASAVPQGAPQSDAELNAFYNANLPRYTIPERRVIRYATFGRERFAALEPSEAEIAATYRQEAARYAAGETRDLSQVVVPTEAAAKALAAQVAGGTTLAAAAQSAGLEAVTLADQTKPAFAGLTSVPIANAAFAAAQGAVATPARSGLGWHVVRVDAIETIPGRSLAQVGDEIAARLKTAKIDQATADFVAKVEDQVADGATFDEIVQAQRLQPVATPPLTRDGRNPDAPAAPADAEAAALIAPLFDAETEDDPVVEAIGSAGRYALVKLDRIVAAAPRPLAQIREQAATDFVFDRAKRAAQRIATDVAAKVSKGADFAATLAAAGVGGPGPQPIGGRRQDMVREGAQVPKPLELMFLMREGAAKIVESPDGQGWLIVHLVDIEPGDARRRPEVVQATQQEFVRVLGQEYAQQFVNAAKAAVGVERDRPGIERLKKRLLGQ